MKRCTKCGQTKALDAFGRNTKGRDGRKSWCLVCHSEDQRRRYRENIAESRRRSREAARRARANDPQAVRARYRRYYRENEERRAAHRHHKLMSMYGISLEEFEEMRAAQHDLCAVCGLPPRDGDALDVDHSHDDGRVRALLCRSCNLGLGSFAEDPGRLIAAAAYLIAHGAVEGSRTV